MDTINIINDFDQKFLMENVLILNQQKLLEMVFGVFNTDFKDIPNSELTIEFVMHHFNQLGFINWELTLRLLNLKTSFNNGLLKQTSSSIEYIISLCVTKSHTKIIEFLLGLPDGMIKWNISQEKNMCLLLSYEIFYSNDNIIDWLINSKIIDLELWYKQFNNTTPIGLLFSFLKEEQLFKIIKTNKFDINRIYTNSTGYKSNIIGLLVLRNFSKILEYIYENNYEINYEIMTKKRLIYTVCKMSNFDIIKVLVKNGFDFNDYNYNVTNSLLLISSEQILMYLIKENNLKPSNDIFYHAVQNNWESIIRYYFESDSIEWVTLNFTWVLTKLILYGYFDLVKIVSFKNTETFFTNLYNGVELYYLDPYGLCVNVNNIDNTNNMDNKYNNMNHDKTD